jgi:hypothetical protein
MMGIITPHVVTMIYHHFFCVALFANHSIILHFPLSGELVLMHTSITSVPAR